MLRAKNKIDPRWLQIFALTFYAFSLRAHFHFQQSYSLIFLGLAFGIGLDKLITFLFFKERDLKELPLSAIIISISSCILMDANGNWLYMISIAIGIFSKAFLLIDEKHFLNPSNFGTIIVLTLFPFLATNSHHIVGGDSLIPTLVLMLIGTITTVYAKQWATSLGWFAGFILVGFFRSFLQDIHPLFIWGNLFSPAFHLYAFHMITDPRTSPEGNKKKFLYGCFLSLIDGGFRALYWPNGIFFSLLFGGITLGTLKVFKLRKNWKPLVIGTTTILTAFVVETFWIKDERRGVTSKNVPFRFSEVSNELGIDFKYFYPPVEFTENGERSLIEHEEYLKGFYIGNGVLVHDFNQDGFKDFFVIQGDQAKGGNKLYINQNGKGFIDKAKEYGLQVLPKDLSPTSLLLIHLNNDEKLDLLFFGLGCIQAYQNMGNHFINMTNSSPFKGDCSNSHFGTLWDFDNDGDLDLFVERYFPKSNILSNNEDLLKIKPLNNFYTENSQFNDLYKNEKGIFVKTKNIFTNDKTFWTFGSIPFDLDGKPPLELYVSNDFGPDQVWKYSKGKLVEPEGTFPFPDRLNGMGVTPVYLKGKKKPHLFVSNIFRKRYRQKGNMFWSVSNNGQLKNESQKYEVNNCQWAWGAAFGDYDHDGYQDLYVANGLKTTNEDDKLTKISNYNLGTISTMPNFITNLFSMREMVRDQAANQTDCFYKGFNGGFEEVSKNLSFMQTWDGRSVTNIDFDNDGDLDLIVTTANKGTKFFKNNLKKNNNWIGFDLIPDRGNYLNVGVKIEIQQRKFKRSRFSTGGKNGQLSISDNRLHFGLRGEGLVTAKIIWADGKTKVLTKLKPGKYYQVTSPHYLER